MDSTDVVHDLVDSPIGELLLAARARGLAGIWFDRHRHPPPPSAIQRRDDGSAGDASAVLREARAQLAAYFAGARTTFDLPLAAEGTPFQARVWDALLDVPYGETVSYAELARRVGATGAARAVGAANGRNPLSIVVPCHRVVGAAGALTGYGGGMDRKRWLLAHEVRHRAGTLWDLPDA